MIDLKFTKHTLANGVVYQDIGTKDSDIEVVSGDDEVIQNATIRCQFYKGEWFLNANTGVDYFGTILKKNADIVDIDREIKKAILETPEVLRLTFFESTTVNREYQCRFRADTKNGEIDASIEELKV